MRPRLLRPDPADFLSPLPEQGIHVAFEDPALGLKVGLWQSSPMQEPFGPYPGDEVVFILDGAVTRREVPTHPCKPHAAITPTG